MSWHAVKPKRRGLIQATFFPLRARSWGLLQKGQRNLSWIVLVSLEFWDGLLTPKGTFSRLEGPQNRPCRGRIAALEEGGQRHKLIVARSGA